jgi:hypothetical protein
MSLSISPFFEDWKERRLVHPQISQMYNMIDARSEFFLTFCGVIVFHLLPREFKIAFHGFENILDAIISIILIFIDFLFLEG